MKRPEFIESLEAKAKNYREDLATYQETAKAAYQVVATSVNILELIRYMKVLERAFDDRVRVTDGPLGIEVSKQSHLSRAEIELFPEAANG